MFTFTVGLGFSAFIMAYEILAIAIKAWAVKRTQRPRPNFRFHWEFGDMIALIPPLRFWGFCFMLEYTESFYWCIHMRHNIPCRDTLGRIVPWKNPRTWSLFFFCWRSMCELTNVVIMVGLRLDVLLDFQVYAVRIFLWMKCYLCCLVISLKQIPLYLCWSRWSGHTELATYHRAFVVPSAEYENQAPSYYAIEVWIFFYQEKKAICWGMQNWRPLSLSSGEAAQGRENPRQREH